MTILTSLQQAALDLSALFGIDATLVVPTATYDTDGTVAETTQSVAVTVAGPVDESKRYAATSADSRVTATFYLSGQSLTVTPTNACRITYGSRTWVVYETTPYEVNGSAAAYRLDCGEVGA